MQTSASALYSGPSYHEIILDYDKVIELDKNFPYAYYNSSYVKCLAGEFDGAIENLTQAIELEPYFAEAYFNRGLTYLYIENTKQGCVDLSRAGELGLSDAYNIILRYCTK